MLVQSGLGFPNPFSAIAKGASAAAGGVARVATDRRFQNVAKTAAQAYAPGQYAQVARTASQAAAILRPNQPRPAAPMMPMMPTAPIDPDSGLPPTRDSHLLMYAGIGAGVLLLVILLKR